MFDAFHVLYHNSGQDSIENQIRMSVNSSKAIIQASDSFGSYSVILSINIVIAG